MQKARIYCRILDSRCPLFSLASQVQKEIDRLSKEYRELDTRIQELNWKTDVMEWRISGRR